ncbi:ral guanine nucleotide dissociation stimulator isoform X9 [Pipistrellus kuhlii]|uniref:ral guanine nucleotide dissociation stimulator isoform X9 n=1 Tax=Pipistrellus kuhlii TaxID=59472 RepID=UPI001E26F7C3|nr:ral guanine nucleotide dissociation stimulator isoform X9 [Pipistrellus kuhlii]
MSTWAGGGTGVRAQAPRCPLGWCPPLGRAAAEDATLPASVPSRSLVCRCPQGPGARPTGSASRAPARTRALPGLGGAGAALGVRPSDTPCPPGAVQEGGAVPLPGLHLVPARQEGQGAPGPHRAGHRQPVQQRGQLRHHHLPGGPQHRGPGPGPGGGALDRGGQGVPGPQELLVPLRHPLRAAEQLHPPAEEDVGGGVQGQRAGLPEAVGDLLGREQLLAEQRAAGQGGHLQVCHAGDEPQEGPEAAEGDGCHPGHHSLPGHVPHGPGDAGHRHEGLPVWETDQLREEEEGVRSDRPDQAAAVRLQQLQHRARGPVRGLVPGRGAAQRGREPPGPQHGAERGRQLALQVLRPAPVQPLPQQRGRRRRTQRALGRLLQLRRGGDHHELRPGVPRRPGEEVLGVGLPVVPGDLRHQLGVQQRLLLLGLHHARGQRPRPQALRLGGQQPQRLAAALQPAGGRLLHHPGQPGRGQRQHVQERPGDQPGQGPGRHPQGHGQAPPGRGAAGALRAGAGHLGREKAEDSGQRQRVLRHELRRQLRLRPEEAGLRQGGQGPARRQLHAAPREAEGAPPRQGHLLAGPRAAGRGAARRALTDDSGPGQAGTEHCPPRARPRHTALTPSRCGHCHRCPRAAQGTHSSTGSDHCGSLRATDTGRGIHGARPLHHRAFRRLHQRPAVRPRSAGALGEEGLRHLQVGPAPRAPGPARVPSAAAPGLLGTTREERGKEGGGREGVEHLYKRQKSCLPVGEGQYLFVVNSKC